MQEKLIPKSSGLVKEDRVNKTYKKKKSGHSNWENCESP